MDNIVRLSALRAELDDFLRQVQSGNRFVLCHYKLQVGTLGKPTDIPSEYRHDLIRAGFTDVRDDVSLIRKTLAKGKTLIVTKRRSRTGERIDKAAIWPIAARQVELMEQRIEELRGLIENLEATALRLQGTIRGWAPEAR